MRRGCLGIGIIAALVAAAPAHAANQTVTVSSDVFTPAAVTVFQSESVTWNNTDGLHNVHFEDNSFVEPSSPSSVTWTASRTFNSVGTFKYYCEVHAPDMSGTVTVQAAGTIPGPGPGPMQPQSVTADKTAPGLKLAGHSRQRVLRSKAVVVSVQVDEASTVVARGRIPVPGSSRVIRLKKASKQLGQGAQSTLELKISKPKLRALRRALLKRPRLIARVTVTATDQAGNRRSAKRKVRLVR